MQATTNTEYLLVSHHFHELRNKFFSEILGSDLYLCLLLFISVRGLFATVAGQWEKDNPVKIAGWEGLCDWFDILTLLKLKKKIP